MPYYIEQQDNQFCVIKLDGSTVACHDSKRSAISQIRALYASEGLKVGRDVEIDALMGKPEEPSPMPDNAKEWRELVLSPNRTGWIQNALKSLFGGLKEGHTIWRTKAGKRRMLIVTTNSYEDRDGETITTNALKNYVDNLWDGDKFLGSEPLLFWHDDRVKIGNILYTDLYAPFLVEVAEESNDPIASYFWDYAETTKEELGASHRFYFEPSTRQEDGTFTNIVKTETSLLPRWACANLLTYAGVIDNGNTGTSI